MNFNKIMTIINTIIAVIAIYIAWSIPYNIHNNEQEFNLQGLDNLLNYSIISNTEFETGTNNGYVKIYKDDLINTLDNSLDKMTNISKDLFNNKCSNKYNSGALNKLGNINNNFYDSVFTYFSNLKREIRKIDEEKIVFPICNDNLSENNINYNKYYPCLSRVIGNCLK